MAECLAGVISKAVHGHRLVQTYKHCSHCMLGLHEQGAGGAVARKPQHPLDGAHRGRWRLPPAQHWDGTHSTAPTQSTRAGF